jgi:hypothetical protein
MSSFSGDILSCRCPPGNVRLAVTSAAQAAPPECAPPQPARRRQQRQHSRSAVQARAVRLRLHGGAAGRAGGAPCGRSPRCGAARKGERARAVSLHAPRRTRARTAPRRRRARPVPSRGGARRSAPGAHNAHCMAPRCAERACHRAPPFSRRCRCVPMARKACMTSPSCSTASPFRWTSTAARCASVSQAHCGHLLRSPAFARARSLSW